jgi:hypothetical protein
MQSWVTQASKDDGVDAVAVNEDPSIGANAGHLVSIVLPAGAVRSWGC